MARYTAGVLASRLQDEIDRNWARILPYYNDLYEYFESRGLSHVSIEAKLLKKLREDIGQDGPEFLETQNGIGSRLTGWLVEILGDMRGWR